MKVFTTGQVAKICKVAPRTVSKWFDSGRLKGYRIPGSQDRRIPREFLIKFLKEHGMPLGDLEDEAMAKVLVVAQDQVLIDNRAKKTKRLINVVCFDPDFRCQPSLHWPVRMTCQLGPDETNSYACRQSVVSLHNLLAV